MSGPRITEIDGEPAFLFALGRVKQTLALAAMAAFTAGGVYAAADGETLIGGVLAVVFGILTLFGVYTLVGKRGLALTPTRVIVLGLGAGEMPWEAVGAISVDDDGTYRFLHVYPTDQALVRRRRSGPAWLARLNTRLEPDGLRVPARMLAGSPEVAIQAVTKYRNHPDRRADIGTERELGYMRR